MEKNRISIRNLRSNLKGHLDSGKAVEIGGPYDLRAILVSIPKHPTWDRGEKHKALAAAKRNFTAAIRAAAE